MSDELLSYYERELTYLRQLGTEFAQNHPKVASRLGLETHESSDPHVERLIQAFAFLAARIRHKIDDEFPEITEALLNVLYPHYLAPIPSLSLVQFVLDPNQGKVTGGHRIERGAILNTDPIAGTRCRFRTCYPVTLWPLELSSAGFETPRGRHVLRGAASILRLELRCMGGLKLEALELRDLRFFLHGESFVVHRLYELLFNHTVGVQLQGADGTPIVHLSPESLRPVGFGSDEGLFPYPSRSFRGYRLLQEYFTFPEKFFFFDACELDHVTKQPFGDRFDICIYLDRQPGLEEPINADTFRLGCTPIVNLFEQSAEPIRVDHSRTDYRIVPDQRRLNAIEVYSVDAVVGAATDRVEPVRFEPFFAFRQSMGDRRPQSYWYSFRRPSPRAQDAGTESYLSLVDESFRSAVPPVETLTVHLTCTNRDLPGRLDVTGEAIRFQIEGRAPLSRIRCLKTPTKSIRSHLDRRTQWRLTSHLSLNYLSLCEDGGDALREILKLYNLAADPDAARINQDHIDAIIGVKTRRVVRRSSSFPWNGFCRGLEVTLGFNEEKFAGSSIFLFAAVIDAFLGLYASINSFTQLVATTRDGKQILKQWAPRAGEQILL